MRRLAKQDRDDKYASRRDYQEIFKAAATQIELEPHGRVVRLSKVLDPAGQKRVAGFGGYIRSGQSGEYSLRFTGCKPFDTRGHVGLGWSRIGHGILIDHRIELGVELRFDADINNIDAWGLTIGFCDFPAGTVAEAPDLKDLNVSHLLPETLYLDHVGASHQFNNSTRARTAGSPIELKKCSYCGRQLPVGPGQPGRLAFHKHNAKLSGHQNECRSCKKWRINNSFNPLRTVDQLNESSLITRERRLLLREPEILRSIKEREGRGLKSIVWDRFGRRCFYCKKAITLKEVELDHTRPLAYLWPIDEYATCLCAEHNNHKKDEFPIDFYTSAQLKELAAITGLAFSKLKVRKVCEEQLGRIRADIVAFARGSDARAFNAIARKVREIRSDVDLWAELRDANRRVYNQVYAASLVRPAGISLSKAAAVDSLIGALEE